MQFNEVVLDVILEQIKILYEHTSENFIDQSRLLSVLKLVQKDEVYPSIVKDIYEIDLPEDLLHELLSKITNKQLLHSLYQQSRKQLDDNDFESLDEVKELLLHEEDADDESFEGISLSLEDQIQEQSGYDWPLEKLRQRLGPLPHSTHGLIAAPVETGKTALVTGCSLHFRRQGARILHINNEDPRFKLLERYYINFFELPKPVIEESVGEYSKVFADAHGNDLKIIDQSDITPFKLDYLVRGFKPDVVFIDQIDHMARDSEAATLERLYFKVRSIAKKHNTRVISVSQASDTKEPYLSLRDLHNSKVGKQGQLDYMIGLVKPEHYPLNRNVSLPKNKLTGDHSPCIIKFNPVLIRYED